MKVDRIRAVSTRPVITPATKKHREPKEYPATLSSRWTREIRELYADSGEQS